MCCMLDKGCFPIGVVRTHAWAPLLYTSLNAGLAVVGWHQHQPNRVGVPCVYVVAAAVRSSNIMLVFCVGGGLHVCPLGH